MNKKNPKEVFKNCGTCSQTFAHILNREFGHVKEEEERALAPLAGGIINQGHQCGMLWGATLAIGEEAFQRHNDRSEAIAVSVTATQHIVESFVNRTNTLNCKEIIGYDLNSVTGMVSFMLKTMVKGMNNSQCFVLADEWAPEAIQAGKDGLSSDQIHLENQPVSCASEVVKKMGGSDEEMVMVSGFAGGLGLSGNACGALSAAIWMKTLAWCKENPGKTPSMFNNPVAKKIVRSFQEETDSEMLCSNITGKKFNSINDHSEFISNGGCEKLLNLLSKV